MAELHFLRPLWLALLPVAIWAAWRIGTGRGGASGWRAVVDRALQPHVLSEGERVGQRRWPVLVMLAASILALLALAGPTWDRVSVPAYRSDESLVVALDLSRSMDATDIEPTRLARARLKLLDLLDRRDGGQTALVVFTANAFTVTPLTNDTRTISALVNALSTDIMPSQGSRIEIGLDKAAELLQQTGVTRGDVLLITDATPSPRAFEVAEALEADGITTSVLAVGTEAGAPVPVLEGGFLTDDGGDLVVPQLNFNALERLAVTGGGRFAVLAAGDSDLERLFPRAVAGPVSAADGEPGREAEIWQDRGVWLCLALLPLIAIGFRRGWVYLIVAGVVVAPAEGNAFEWADLWLRPDQQGVRAMQRDAPAEAAAVFEDPEWLGAARYRAGQYDASAAALAGIDTAEANYNRGNALARSGNLAEAIEAYDRTLALVPDHADAEYNRELVAELLEQQEQENQSDSAEPDPAGESQAGADQEQQGQESQDPSTGEGSQEQQQAESGERDDGTEQSAEAESPDAVPEPGDAEESESGEQPLVAAASPEEVEDWASEQAAEQWLRRVPQDPGGLLRRKFLYQYQQLGVDQDGNQIFPGSDAEPW